MYRDLEQILSMVAKSKKVKDEKAWRDIVRHFRGQKKASFKENYKTITIENDKDRYRKHYEWRCDTPYEWEEENFVLNYKTREVRYTLFVE